MMRFQIAIASVVLWTVLGAAGPATEVRADDVWRVYGTDERPHDVRLGELRTLNDAYHPWIPPTTKEAWEEQARNIRERVLVSTGLWPMPPKIPLKPTAHGRIERDDYVVEKVYFASYPGHYVCGNLYRPREFAGKAPGVLCPHGHWQDARFYDAGEEAARKLIADGAEKFMAAARHPLQARMVQLARMGCVVFHYDMVGYCDSKPIAHREGFTDVEAGLRLENFMGLQTWNSIRALDYLTSLPEVDSRRIGVTGASGGGTQTFILCAVDPRPTVAFPAVMVSTAMQGGCVCENADYLRIGINNVAIAATFAPRPLALSGANDWTIDIETKGLPELQQIYSLYGKRDCVYAKAYPPFPHNYNCVSREMMYAWFNRHLDLQLEEPVLERDFEPLSREELSVFDADHPRPGDTAAAGELRQTLSRVSDEQYRELIPKNLDEAGAYRDVVGTAARVMFDLQDDRREAECHDLKIADLDGIELRKGVISQADSGEQVPFVWLAPSAFNGSIVVWIDSVGKSHMFDRDGRPKPEIRKLLDSGHAVVSADVFLTGELVKPDGAERFPEVNSTYHGFTFGYNRPVLSNRVRDILKVLDFVAGLPETKSVRLVGTGDAGPWVLLARGQTRRDIAHAIADARGFSFSRLTSSSDPMFLPGALKYGGLGGLAALAAPTRLTVAGVKDIPRQELSPLTEFYRVTAGQLELIDDGLTAERVAELLTK